MKQTKNRNSAGHAIFKLMPDNEPNWDHWDNGEWGRRQRLTHFKNMILKGTQAAGKKPVSWNKIKEISQEPMENPLAFPEHLRECLWIYTTTDPESLEGNAILRLYLISQSAPDIRHKLQELKIEPDSLSSYLVMVAYWVITEI